MRRDRVSFFHKGNILSIVLSGRNDNYGGNFNRRFFRAAKHNVHFLEKAGIEFEYLFVEWNPIPGQPLLSDCFLRTIKQGRAVVVGPDVHAAYGLNPSMDFYEMPAKNAGVRRAVGGYILVTNADILFDEALVTILSDGQFDNETFYRAHRVDVPCEAEWPELREPRCHLRSGEGRLPPPYYLGAGGDFTLASKSLWERVRGFDEEARFTTRAKDWRFFLSVAALGFPIELIGDVYHLDHEEGFCNTDTAKRNSSNAHFGGMWDFEFGLPAINRSDWGLKSCRERLNDDGRRVFLEVADVLFSWDEEVESRRWMKWLTFPYGQVDWASANLFHAILVCQERKGRLICRISDPRSAVACSGLARVAAEAGISVFSDWEWPASEQIICPLFVPEPDSLQAGDLILNENAKKWCLLDFETKAEVKIFPDVRPPEEPRYNPFLVRRLLRVMLRARQQGFFRLALYGAGGHTEELLRWGFPDDLSLKMILSSWDQGVSRICDIPVIRFPCAKALMDVDSVVLSSVTFEAEMTENIRSENMELPILALYADWPGDFWKHTI